MLLISLHEGLEWDGEETGNRAFSPVEEIKCSLEKNPLNKQGIKIYPDSFSQNEMLRRFKDYG